MQFVNVTYQERYDGQMMQRSLWSLDRVAKQTSWDCDCDDPDCDCEEETIEFTHVIVSDNGSEVLVFPANADGTILRICELDACYPGIMNIFEMVARVEQSGSFALESR